MGSKGPGHPPLLHPPPSIWVQEQQKLRLVQIAEALYSVLSGGWHGDSRGADDKEGWSTSAMKPLRPLRSLPPQQCGDQRPAALPPPPPDPAGPWVGAGRICLPASHKPYMSKFLARGRACWSIPQPGQQLITVSPGRALKAGRKRKFSRNLRYKIVSFTSPQSQEPETLEGMAGVLKEEMGSGRR